ncbi:restriction endonuclease [Paenibacillus sp. MER TA 81-3]|uniref:restriction endonuclease n=1 Tax=Paenibacillus sp. MER TA 81-3 TaxID=2939573 RepID=UPI00203ECA40|nr:restriction endonuclease [Paenibacillus sp. MER TA 81-3]MCM3341176.1 restriction endonuclease [Paenibacillus sp. MER TA 81-3]
MAVPDYQAFMYPFLKLLEDGQDHTLQEAYEALANYFQLSLEDREELIPSGKQLVYHNRIGWARTYLKKAHLLSSPKRGTFRITERGREVLTDPEASSLNLNYLMRYEEFLTFKQGNKTYDLEKFVPQSQLSPRELLEENYELVQSQVCEELLERIMACTSEFFERLVVELLVSMGYGGSIQDAGRAIGRSGDDGIDGIIKEDVLGLDMIYIQAKRWKSVVGRPEIQRFVGSLEGNRARKGVFITTSDFTKEALEYVRRIEKKIILLNGIDLTRYMYQYDVGVAEEQRYSVKKVNIDFFED